MPNTFCSLCGTTHEVDNLELCESLRGEGKAATRSSRRTTGKMSKTAMKEETAEVLVEASSSTMLDRKREIERAIEDLRLEEEVATLESEMKRLMARKEKRVTAGVPKEQEGVEPKDKMALVKAEAPAPVSEETAVVPKAGYSAYGRARRRSRETRKKRSSSSSSTSRSESRRRRRKWCLKRYTLNKKNVEKLNCYELICATAMWV